MFYCLLLLFAPLCLAVQQEQEHLHAHNISQHAVQKPQLKPAVSPFNYTMEGELDCKDPATPKHICRVPCGTTPSVYKEQNLTCNFMAASAFDRIDKIHKDVSVLDGLHIHCAPTGNGSMCALSCGPKLKDACKLNGTQMVELKQFDPAPSGKNNYKYKNGIFASTIGRVGTWYGAMSPQNSTSSPPGTEANHQPGPSGLPGPQGQAGNDGESGKDAAGSP